MKVIESIAEFKQARVKLKGTLGFVPTMGYLHEGHITLVRYSKKECNNTAVSIFVNPTQFLPNEDFRTYPRDPERDLSMLEKAGTDLVFMPPTEEMYPTDYSTYVEVSRVTERLEGASRPGHFRGVATVVAKLFNIVQANKAYFGQKDAQQFIVIKKMVSDLNFDLDIVAVPTVREPDGLAMSSRNTYLSSVERTAAIVLWKSLQLAKGKWDSGERDAGKIKADMIALIKREPLAVIDYISIANPENLEELTKITGSALVSMAVKIGKTRLIDNIALM